jgi:hypothetical protein
MYRPFSSAFGGISRTSQAPQKGKGLRMCERYHTPILGVSLTNFANDRICESKGQILFSSQENGGISPYIENITSSPEGERVENVREISHANGWTDPSDSDEMNGGISPFPKRVIFRRYLMGRSNHWRVISLAHSQPWLDRPIR